MMGFKVPGSNALSAGRLQCGVLLAQTPRRRFCEAANWEAVSQASSIGACLYTTEVPSAANRHPRSKRGVWPFWNASSLSSLLYFWPEPIRDFRVV